MRKHLIAGLIACGWKQQPSTSSKYLTFSRAGDEHKLFVGNSAALRRGRAPSNSISVSDTKTREAYITIGKLVKKIATEQQARELYTFLRTATVSA